MLKKTGTSAQSSVVSDTSGRQASKGASSRVGTGPSVTGAEKSKERSNDEPTNVNVTSNQQTSGDLSRDYAVESEVSVASKGNPERKEQL